MKKSILVIIGSLSLLASADVKMPALFSDNMVLQQGETANIWGWADPGEKVTVKGNWDHKPVTAVTPENGKWKIKLPLPYAGGPFQLKINGKNRILFDNVMVGEVWICSGQSNMEWGISKFPDTKNDIQTANLPNIRLFKVERCLSTIPKETLDSDERWKVCTPTTVTEGRVGGFSATAFYFARYLQKQLKVPVGVIESAWGGTPAEAWTPEETLKEIGGYENLLADIEKKRIPQSEIEKKNRELMTGWKTKMELADPGLSGKWYQNSFSPKDWKTMNCPKLWENELKNFDGVVWFKKFIEIPENWKNRPLILELGTIDDQETTWFSGEKVGENKSWDSHRRYTIAPAKATTGKVAITVRVVDIAGAGGFSGKPEDMVIYPAGDKKSGISLAGDWSYKATATMAQLPKAPQQIRLNQHMGSVLYNGMINPLLNLSFKGFTWYQGESNAFDAYRYEKLFSSMIKSWRQKFNHPDHPFYFVQIAPFCYDNPHRNGIGIQEAQRRTLSLKNTGMAVTNDIGNTYNIHPAQKSQVGKRLALLALRKTYGGKIIYSGPLFKEFKVEGDKIRCHFEQANGLNAPNELKLFKICGNDGIFIPAKAVIDGTTVVVSSPLVKEPVGVNYAWSDAATGELFNKAQLPASPFNTIWDTELDKKINTVRPSPRRGWWAKRHAVKQLEAQSGEIDLLFVGDSITQGWEGAGRTVWDKFYGNRKAMNIGFSGDRTEHVLWRLDNGEVDEISPKVAVLMIGTNNTGDYNPRTNSGEETALGVTSIIKSLRAKLPTTKILIISTFPSGEAPNKWRERNQNSNKIVAKLADNKHIFYLDIFDKFLDKDKKLSKEIMPDLLHPNTKGYQIWAEAMEPTLKKLLEN